MFVYCHNELHFRHNEPFYFNADMPEIAFPLDKKYRLALIHRMQLFSWKLYPSVVLFFGSFKS